jgi:hypothetical protein
MSQLVKEVASEVDQAFTTPLSMLGMYKATFNFSASKTSTRTETVTIPNLPAGWTEATIALQSFDLFYINDKENGYGRLQAALNVSGSQASCGVTLRDNHTDHKEWEGTVTGIVTFFGKAF